MKLRGLSEPTRRVLILLLVIVLAVASFFTGYIIGYNYGMFQENPKVTHHKEASLELSSDQVLNELEKEFPDKLNYTQLLEWESTRLNYTKQARTPHSNPIEILESGIGKCGEFSILYVSICLANGIPARLVVLITGEPGDHVWAEVNPSTDNKTWVHVDPTECCARLVSGRSIYEPPSRIDNPSLYEKDFDWDLGIVCAFQITAERQVLVIDRTWFYTS